MTLQEVRDDLVSLGLNDNLELATLLYLSATARKTENKISILVSGPAGLGKSHLAKTVLSLFPEEDIISSSRMTPAGLMNLEDLSGKILFIYERFEDQLFAQYIRELMTEGEVRYTTVTGERCLKGPVTLIETTVDHNIVGTENKTRCFVVGINTSSQARNSILDKQKILRTIKGFAYEKTFNKIQKIHKQLQQKLDPCLRVLIPFAEEIKFQASSYHSPRILQRILNVINTIAYLNQKEREIKNPNDVRYIEATKDDFEEAKQLLISLPIDEDGAMLSCDEIEFINILRLNRDKLLIKSPFTRNDVVEAMPCDSHYRSYKVVAKNLHILINLGFIDELPIRGLKNRVEYRLNKYFPYTALDKSAINYYSTLSLS